MRERERDKEAESDTIKSNQTKLNLKKKKTEILSATPIGVTGKTLMKTFPAGLPLSVCLFLSSIQNKPIDL